MTKPTIAELNAARRHLPLTADGRLQRLDVADLLSRPEPMIDWLWDGYLEAGTVAQLHGNGGAGKSILALALARAITGGHDFLGRRTWPERVLVIDGENPTSEVHRRLSRLDFKSVADKISYWQAQDAIFGDLAKAEEMLCQHVAAHRAGLVVLDSQRALWYGEENEAGAVRQFLAMLRRVANTTAATILDLHHDAKHGGYSGSTDLNAGVDSRLHLIRNEDDGSVMLRHEKLRSDVEQPPLRYHLHLEDGLYAFTLEQVHTDQGRVLEALTDEWQISEEIAQVASVRRVEAEHELRALTRAGRAEHVVGPDGRHPTAKCWRLPQKTRDGLGRVAASDAGDHPSPDLHTPVGGGVGTGQGREPVPAPDEWLDPVDHDLRAEDPQEPVR
jgi:hypothetical protein